jgi:hypothetical protein
MYPQIALDYLATRELRGNRRWKVAQSEVAVAWGVERETVADAWTDSKAYASWKLAELLRGRQPRRKLLEDLSADLREQYARPGRR